MTKIVIIELPGIRKYVLQDQNGFEQCAPIFDKYPFDRQDEIIKKLTNNAQNHRKN